MAGLTGGPNLAFEGVFTATVKRLAAEGVPFSLRCWHVAPAGHTGNRRRSRSISSKCWSGIGLAKEGDDFIRARAADDPPRIKAQHLGDGGAQRAMIGRRVAMQIIGRAAVGFDGGRAGPQRVFVRAEFDHIIKARDMRRTPLIKVNLHNARLRCDLCHLALSSRYCRPSIGAAAVMPESFCIRACPGQAVALLRPGPAPRKEKGRAFCFR